MPAFVSNGIAYSDDKFIQTTQPEYQMSAGQPSSAVIVFRGPAPKLKDFIANLSKNKVPDFDPFGAPIEKTLFRSYNVRHHPQFPYVELTFDISKLWERGAPVDSKRAASAQISVDIPSGLAVIQLQITAQYKAPTTTYVWITDRKPGEDPPDKYSKVRFRRNPIDLSSNPRYVVNNTGTGTLEEMSPASISAILKKNVIDSVEDYDVEELIPERFWRCTTTVSRILKSDAFVLTT